MIDWLRWLPRKAASVAGGTQDDRIAELEQAVKLMDLRQKQLALLIAENVRLQNQMMVRQTQLLEVLAAGLAGGPGRPQ